MPNHLRPSRVCWPSSRRVPEPGDMLAVLRELAPEAAWRPPVKGPPWGRTLLARAA